MKVAFLSEMARKANENEFRTSKMAAGGHFEQKDLKLHFYLKLREIQTKINFGHPHVHLSCFEWYHFRLTVLHRKLVIHFSLQYSRARDILYTTVSCFCFFRCVQYFMYYGAWECEWGLYIVY